VVTPGAKNAGLDDLPFVQGKRRYHHRREKAGPACTLILTKRGKGRGERPPARLPECGKEGRKTLPGVQNPGGDKPSFCVRTPPLPVGKKKGGSSRVQKGSSMTREVANIAKIPGLEKRRERPPEECHEKRKVLHQAMRWLKTFFSAITLEEERERQKEVKKVIGLSETEHAGEGGRK